LPGERENRAELPARAAGAGAYAVVAYTIVRRCGEIARDRGLARQFSTSERRPRSHSTVSLGLLYAEASAQILQQALGITPTPGFSSAV
jgi:hypothetical protein